MKPGAIILAAGESGRMGRPKALLPFRDGTFLSVLAQTLSGSCAPVIAVFGANAELIMAQAPASVITARNDQYRSGMLTSLQAGIRSLPIDSRAAVMFTLVDHPAVSPETVQALARSQAPLAIPRFRGKRGHPVLLRGGMIEEILLEPATSKIHDVIDRHRNEIDYLDLLDPGITDDVDDPGAYERLMVREAERV